MIKALVLTFLVGICFLIGIIIPKFYKNKEKLILFTTGLTFIIMLYLICFDLIPEIIELLDPFHNIKYSILILIFGLLGLFLLKILDFFIPEHHHEHHKEEKNIEEHNQHIFHIGLVTSIALILHNLLEGTSIYIAGIHELKLGILMSISVGCHNIPLGMEIAASMDIQEKNKKTKWIVYTCLILSSFLGAFLLFLFNKELNILIEGILLSLTFGMLIYLCIFELIPEIRVNWKERKVRQGMLLGFIIAILLLFL